MIVIVVGIAIIAIFYKAGRECKGEIGEETQGQSKKYNNIY
jgi:hypothetical protein